MTSVCYNNRLPNELACGTKAHRSPKASIMADAYYPPGRNRSLIPWPFVRSADLEAAGELNLVLPARTSAEHVDEFNKFYARHPQVYQVVRSLPCVVALLGSEAENAGSSSVFGSGSLSHASGRRSTASNKQPESVVGVDQGHLKNEDDPSLGSLDSSNGSVCIKLRLSDQEADFHTPQGQGNSVFSSVPSVIVGVVPPVMVAEFKSFNVPLEVGDLDLLESEEPWLSGVVMLRDGLRAVTAKVLDLANLTVKACQEHSDEATAKTVKAISKLQARQHALRDDLDAGYPRSST
jgi:hypothetical protein